MPTKPQTITLFAFSALLALGCSEEPPTDNDQDASGADQAPAAEIDAMPAPPTDPAAAFQNVADTIVRVMNADDRMQGELTVVEATLQPGVTLTQPGAAVGTILLSYQSKELNPSFACTVKLGMENAGEFWDLDRRNREMFDFKSSLVNSSPQEFNSQVDWHTEIIRNVMDEHLYKREIANALNVPKP